ncbi:MAG: hypothetical protein AB7E36_13585 [Salinivirgaceae bacterium]
MAKGDTIAKGIYREKPDFEDTNEPVVLFSTESKLKATGYSIGSDYITDLYVSIRSSNTTGTTGQFDGLTWNRIPVDLNEGAGGYYIYLYYRKDPNSLPIRDIVGIHQNTYLGYVDDIINIHPQYDIVERYGDKRADLNDGAGGDYIYLIYSKDLEDIYGNSPTSAIKNIAIVSGNSSGITYSDWAKVPVDLNKGAGGKYIYLFYKR